MKFFSLRALTMVGALLAAGGWPLIALADIVALQNATATISQAFPLPVSAAIDNIYQNADVANSGWGGHNGSSTPPNVGVFETVSDLNLHPFAGGTLRFNVFAGGFGSHTLGNYRFSYTTDPRTEFADGLANGGDVTANWIPITPSSVISSGGATLTILGDNSVLASGTNPNLSTDTIYATFNHLNNLKNVTGFRIEALEHVSLPDNGPGRPANGNYVVREIDVASFAGTRVALQNGTAQASQGGFSVDNMINGTFPFTSVSGEGWANAVGGGTSGTPSNIATFETVTDIAAGQNLLTIEIMSGGFGQHTLGNFRISATTADRSLFADGNDNGGAGVGNEGIWTVLDPISITSDNPSTVFSEDAANFIRASGTSAEFEHYTLTFLTSMNAITGFRLETPENALLPGAGPGRASNGNFVIREFSVFALATPEPGSIALWSLLGLGAAALAWARRRRRT